MHHLCQIYLTSSLETTSALEQRFWQLHFKSRLWTQQAKYFLIRCFYLPLK